MSGYAKKPQNPNNYVIIDFESGGVDLRVNPVTEVALLSIDGGNLKKIVEYQDLIAPYEESLVYEEKAFKVTNLSLEILEEEGLGVREVAENVLKALEQTNNRQEKSPGLKPILIGHNVPFDINCLHHLMYWGLKNTSLDYQKELERVLHGRIDYFGNFQPTYMDTWSLGKMWFQGEGELTDYKLATLVDKLGIDLNNAHRAMNDVVSTAQVVQNITNNLRSGYFKNYQNRGREGFYFPTP